MHFVRQLRPALGRCQFASATTPDHRLDVRDAVLKRLSGLLQPCPPKAIVIKNIVEVAASPEPSYNPANMRGEVDCAEHEPLANVVRDARTDAPHSVSAACYANSPLNTGTPSLNAGSGPQIDVYDFFSGCGGTSSGLLKAGLTPRIAVDFDEAALATYARNIPEVATLVEDITRLLTSSIEHYFARERVHPILICACAPCQPFSAQNRHKKADDGRLTLLGHLRRFVERFRPELMLIENVPGLDGSRGAVDSPLGNLLGMLDELGYHHDVRILAAHDFGVPQARRRLLVAASLFGPVALPEPTHGEGKLPHVTVRDAIGHLPVVEAGAGHPNIANHRAAPLSAMNLRRIRSSRPGGS